MSLLLAAQRRIVPLANAMAGGEWPIRDRGPVDAIHRLRGQTLGIAGAGRIGRLVARKARGFGFTTIAHDPFLTDAGDPDLELVGLDDLLTRSDAIVICAAYTPGAPPLLSRDALERVRPGVIVVNVARGGHVDELALADALLDGRVGVAALDVRDPEPPDPADDPLAGLPNVIQTPHIAANSREAADDLHRLAAESVLRLLEAAGRIPRWPPDGALPAGDPRRLPDRRGTSGSSSSRSSFARRSARSWRRVPPLLRVRHGRRGLRGRYAAVPAGRRRVLRGDPRSPESSPMVGVIGLSTAQILERIEYAYDVGFRMFQISLPSWGPLADDEVLRFFADTCGRYPGRAVPALQPAADQARPDRSRLRPDHRRGPQPRRHQDDRRRDRRRPRN